MAKLICPFCNKEFERAYRMNATRAARPQFCSRGCASRDNAAKMNAEFAAKFWARLGPPTIPGGCREWTGRRIRDRYGIVDLGGGPKLAHRVAYHLATGLEPGTLEVCHTCDNPPCCEPSHLWLGTHKENMVDMARKGRTNPPILNGENHPAAKLRAADVSAIRRSGLSNNALANSYGTTPQNIRGIRLHKTWKHV